MRDAYGYDTHEDKLYWQPDGCALCKRYKECLFYPEELEDSDTSDDMVLSSDEEEEEPKDSDWSLSTIDSQKVM